MNSYSFLKIQFKTLSSEPGVVVHTFVIPALRRLRQEDCELQARLSYIARPCLKNKPTQKVFFSVKSFLILLGKIHSSDP
jgi:hypothetical protein